MVLGANLGGTIPSATGDLKGSSRGFACSTWQSFNSYIWRGGLTFFFVPMYVPYLSMIDPDATRQVVNFHTAFNLILALSFLPFTGIISHFCQKLVPDRVERDDAGKARYLDVKDFETPSVALAAATRETLRMADTVQQMLHDTITVLKTNDKVLLEKVREEDNILDRLYEQIKIYMAQLSQEFLDP